MEDDTQSSVVQFPAIGPDRVVDRIRELARDTFNIQWTEHALEKLEERDVTTRQVLTTLRRGRAEGVPEAEEDGGWKVRLERRSAARRLRVVAVLSKDRIIVVTVVIV